MNTGDDKFKYLRTGIAGDPIKEGDHIRFIDPPAVWIICDKKVADAVALESARAGSKFLLRLRKHMVE